MHLDQQQPDNVLKLKHLDYIELYVGNPFQAAYFYRTALGFRPIAYAGLETTVRDRASYVLEQGEIRLVLTGTLTDDGPINEHIRRHGDSVKDIAFEVEDAVAVYDHAVAQGARSVLPPAVYEDQYGQVIKASIAAYGDTIHSFVQRSSYAGPFLPLYVPLAPEAPVQPTGLRSIDHVAVGMEPGQLEFWVDFYKKVLSFHEMHEEMISTEYSAMNSKVVRDSSHQIKFPLVEPQLPASARRSQIDEYLAYHHGPGAQHIALLSDDIIATVKDLKARGIQFLSTPGSYYDMLESRVGRMEPGLLAAIREHHILVDRDDTGLLMQIFSKPLQSRPTLFLEVIQRDGAQGFGAGNIKALFQAVEREQVRRGTL